MFESLALQALLGGVLIGIGAALLLAFNGRIAGISEILYSLLFNPLKHPDRNWRMAFLIGLVGGGYFMLPVEFSLRQGYSPILLVISGLTVGIGTRIGSGCTSGHGVCGIGLMSRRSMVATITLMVTGIITTTILRNFIG